MRAAGAVVALMHERIRAAVAPGVTTRELDAIGRAVIAEAGATSNFLGYHGFPAVICTSVNDSVVHGIPDDTPLALGDLLSVDCGAVVDGWHGDAAFSMVVGGAAANPEAHRLVELAERSLRAAIAVLRDGARLSDIGHAVQSLVEGAGCSVVKEYTGHGIGRAMHERPDIPNWGPAGKGPRLKAGTTLAIEPIITAGNDEVAELEDGWTVVTVDGSLAAHVEHTVAVTLDGAEILTARDGLW
jgi:methionyl aminopeptidase